MKLAWLLFFISFSHSLLASEKADAVLVEKSEAKLFLIRDGKPFKEYSVSFGGSPIGHKQQEGDQRTPEGQYFLDYKKSDSSFHKAIHISYPNKKDQESADKNGVSPGGLIMIHGQKNGYGWLFPITQLFNWTDGCIAFTDREMDEIWSNVDANTPIEIRP
jgi:murein L,D-transpeptidase YafK